MATITNQDPSALNTQNPNQKDEMEEVIILNMIEEFMNISDEDNKIFNLLKEEFKDLKILHYGALMCIQNDDDIENFPNISELLQIYEEIFSNLNMRSSLCLKLEKCIIDYIIKNTRIYIDYVIYNDGLVTIADNGMGKRIYIYKIKTIILVLHTNDTQKTGCYNYRMLKILKHIKYI